MKHSSDLQATINSLKVDFATFRSKCLPSSRVPGHLRESVLKAIDSGVAIPLIKTELGVNGGQLAAWRRERLAEIKDDPRVLEVIPSSHPGGAAVPKGLRVSYEAGRLLVELFFSEV